MAIYGNTGASLKEGRKLVYPDYDIEVDRRPEGLNYEFLEEYDWAAGDVEEEREQIVEDARNFVVDNIVHVNAIAREENVDPYVLDDERIEAQSEDGTLMMSNVWDGAWRDTRAGTCQERSITLHMLHRELDINSKYREGYIRLEGGQHARHGWTSVNQELISDPSNAGEGVTPLEETDRYFENQVRVM